MVTDNVQAIRRLIEEMWNGGKLDVIDELFDPAFEGYDPFLGPHTRDSYRNAVRSYLAAFPDLKFEANQIFAGVGGNYVVTRWTARGTHLGPFLGQPSTGKSVVFTGIHVTDFRNGKIIWQHMEWDALGLFRQLGLQEFAVPPAVRQRHAQQARP